MTSTKRKILVTSALPYANGPIHIGHLVEYIQTDIWARFQKQRGQECYYVCADDAHGTPIMLRAQQEGISPETLINRIHAEHIQDFADFSIGFDNYYSTHSPENKVLSAFIYQRLNESGHITRRTISQAFDPVKQMFLPDRFIKGECPRCGVADQYGDNCEACGATYTPTELKNAVSVVSGAKPIEKDSEHFFVELSHFEDLLKTWMNSGSLQPEVINKINEFVISGLKAWDISRDAPYFGFEIPNAPNKYFYVWLDAPIGYLASFKQLCHRQGIDFDEFLKVDSATELHHFIGKDIVYFHTLFWPALLAGAGFRKPTAVHVHGFLTVNGQKMSKSRGTFITARTYLTHLNPEYLRYYFATKLSTGIDDIDLNFEDFLHRVNADLVGKVVNIASRCAGFITKYFEGQLAKELPDNALYDSFIESGNDIAESYENRDFNKSIRQIMGLADKANQYIDEHKPWIIAKDSSKAFELQAVCTQGLNFFRVIMSYLAPILPEMAKNVESFLYAPLSWQPDALLSHKINEFKPLMQRVEQKSIDALIVDSKETLNIKPVPEKSRVESLAKIISYEDFAKVDLRIARIIKAEQVEGAQKLLKLDLDVGEEKLRTVFAGIKMAYAPEELTGRLTVMVANLAPRQMRFGASEGMILAAGEGEKEIFLLAVDEGAKVGMRVK